MPNPFEPLFAAILNDDRAKVKELLDNDPVLTKRAVAEEGRYESSIAHYVYAGDTVLHVAAAGYRVEIARMLLAAGADFASARNRRCSQPLHYAAGPNQNAGLLAGPTQTGVLAAQAVGSATSRGLAAR